ncbi:MAG: selenocysteine lyase [Bacteroidetes bacterium GWE2_41_25]|nr:MAG: selenocysteine lyase [Bacteroidetes bacterium GWA2_40_15]OFX99340.1 MAG: selenocysteine lyase [Bacteroidetes bacterium GWC2_40_22]OFY05865.1 MAG: selenocysteine lyase [Bacteroidetes bacterium GWE2_41_25]HAM08711.1 selenocysteine lyase [Bacteroidales bacterium]HBQ81644.1 selenocysteine lyase [Bacteroidales bacterium]
MSELENYFSKYRKNIIGIDTEIETPYGTRKLIYADWIASGRLYSPIEKRMLEEIGPMIGNTHSESTATGKAMTDAYHLAQKIVKRHVNANDNDVILFTGTGMTSAIAKLQRILGLKIPEQAVNYCPFTHGEYDKCRDIPNEKRPVVFLTHTEHHSNHTSWFETLADVVVLEPSDDLTVDPDALRREIIKYKDRPLLLGSFSACSNVTGYIPPFYELAKIMHEHNGYCFVDYAASAPYVDIDMHPSDKMQQLDAIFFSPHKFLGGPGSAGVLIFSKELYNNEIPDSPGGGTVKWTNRWGGYSYITDIEVKEDGGTPGFLQGIKAALAVTLKENMDTDKIHERELELKEITFRELTKTKSLHILAGNIKERLGVFSFYIDNVHHNLLTRLLNDRFGIQLRGGCSCAGTYGHFLLDVDVKLSKEITDMIDAGDLSMKPGWIRLSLHPTMTDDELAYICNAINQTVENVKEWQKDYTYDRHTNEFNHFSSPDNSTSISHWFDLDS